MVFGLQWVMYIIHYCCKSQNSVVSVVGENGYRGTYVVILLLIMISFFYLTREFKGELYNLFFCKHDCNNSRWSVRCAHISISKFTKKISVASQMDQSVLCEYNIQFTLVMFSRTTCLCRGILFYFIFSTIKTNKKKSNNQKG